MKMYGNWRPRKNKRGGPRTVQVDNSAPVMKIGLREWLYKKLPGNSVLDVYGAYGMMWEQVWRKKNLER